MREVFRIAALMATAAAACFGQDFENITVQLVANGLKFAEGPVWSLEGYLLFSDTVSNSLQKFVPGKGSEPVGDRPGGPSGNAFDSDGRLYTCEIRERRVVRTAKNGKVDVIAARFEGKRLNAPNDVVVREDGQIYFTDPAFGNQQDAKELDFYGVYHVTPKGEVEAVARWKTRPNGVALSANGRMLYVTDADSRSVKAFDLDRQGKAGNERVLIAKTSGVPGGIRTDEKGNLWVAAGNVQVFSSKGDHLRDIKLLETPSNLAFGDGDLQSLYVTARSSVFRIRTGVKGVLPYAP